MRTLLTVLCLLAVPSVVQGAFNDTGQTQCFNADDVLLEACSEANSGDDSTHPRQDGRFGRDAQALAGTLIKQGAGAAGFDFTRVCNSGEVAGEGDCPPVPQIGPNENDWGCTRDNVTGLLWEVKTAGPGGLRDLDWTYTWFEGGQGVAGTDTCGGTLSGYSNQCNTANYRLAVNATELCGRSDWRLPTRRELLSIVHHGAAGSPSVDTEFFPFTRGGQYLTSGQLTFNPSLVWRVEFFFGATAAAAQGSDAFVRLVQGAGLPASEFVDNEDGTVTDQATGLMWDRCSWGQVWNQDNNGCDGSASVHIWSDALAVASRANELNHRDYTDWRLPNRTELESLVSITAETPSPGIDTVKFPGTPPEWFWSSTIVGNSLDFAWSVGFFTSGDAVTGPRTGQRRVRLVRDGRSYDALAPAEPGGPLAVGVDVRPWADPNWIVLFGRPGTLPRAVGVLPVAILSSASLDAVAINPATVEIGDPLLAGVLSRQLWRHWYQDVNGDGRDDLVLFFGLNAMVAAGALGYDTEELRLTAETFDGAAVAGSDAVRVLRVGGWFAGW